MKTIVNIVLKYFGMTPIEIRIDELVNGYLVNNKYFSTLTSAQNEVLRLIDDYKKY